MKLMVLDGNSIVNRAYYGVKPLTTREGVFTHAIFGFLNILQKLMEEDKPDALCVTFDLKAPTFRHKAFAEYKAQRKGMPEELAMQMPLLKQVLSAMNIPLYQMEGWEADDLIGTISRKCEAAGWDCVAVTGDKDSLQLVTDHTHIKIVVTRMGQTTTKEITPALFQAEYGFAPIHLIDLKALMGDTSDNYPGVPGIGEKTAMTLIQTYGSVDNLYANFDTAQLKPAQRRKLDEGRQSAQLCYDLATIRTDAPMDFHPEDCLCKEWNREALYDLLLKLEFTKLIDRYQLKPAPAAEPTEEDSVTCTVTVDEVQDGARLPEVLALCQQADYVTFLPLPTLDGLAFHLGNEDAITGYFIYQPNVGAGYSDFLKGFFSAAVKKVTHDVKPLMNQLLSKGLSTDGFVFDTALAAYLLSPTDGSYAIDRLFVSYCGSEIARAGDYTDRDAFSPLSDHYNAMCGLLADVSAVDALHDILSPKLAELGMEQLLTDLELPLCSVLAEMERAGFLIDRQALADFGVVLDKGIAQAQADVYGYAGREFNINSPKQLGVVLFEDLQLPSYKKTKTGYSTNADVLEKLRFQHPIIDQILTYRQLAKLKSTYVDGLMKVIGPDGRIHTSFQNTVTATGRLSSTEPNLQNIPVRTPLGAEMRKMFIAAPGNVLVDADYSQIELRLLAHIAGDKVMQQAFRSGTDFHTITAASVFGVPVELVTKTMRSSAKAVNFGIVYGISEFSLAQDIGVTRGEAKEYMDRYFATYSGVDHYMKDVVEQAKRDGYVTTVMGRHRWLPELKSSNFNQRAFGERVALNAPIQGTAADIIKLAMVRVQARLKAEGLSGRLVLQVHDELIVECPESEGERIQALLEEEMEGVVALSVPLTAEAAVGKCWADAH